MKIKPKNTASSKLVVVLAVLIIIIGGYLIYANVTDTWPFNSSKKSANTSDEITNTDMPLGDSNNEANDNPKANIPTEFTPPEDGDKPKNDTLTGIINYVGVVDNNLTIRTTINQLLNLGECRLTLTSESGNTIKETTNITAGPSTSTCDGFSIPKSELTSGEWTILIILKNGNSTGKLKSSVNI